MNVVERRIHTLYESFGLLGKRSGAGPPNDREGGGVWGDGIGAPSFCLIVCSAAISRVIMGAGGGVNHKSPLASGAGLRSIGAGGNGVSLSRGQPGDERVIPM